MRHVVELLNKGRSLTVNKNTVFIQELNSSNYVLSETEQKELLAG